VTSAADWICGGRYSSPGEFQVTWAAALRGHVAPREGHTGDRRREHCVRAHRDERPPDADLGRAARDERFQEETGEETFRRAPRVLEEVLERPGPGEFDFSYRAYVALEQRHLERKVAALERYASQQHRRYANAEYVWNLARTHGVNVNREHAEVFQVYRVVA